jgi:hypothetical protein
MPTLQKFNRSLTGEIKRADLTLHSYLGKIVRQRMRQAAHRPMEMVLPRPWAGGFVDEPGLNDVV